MEYIEREIEPEIVKRLDSGKVNIIYGPRQSGKTTMVRHLVSSQELNPLWLDADMLDVRELVSDMSPEKWRRILQGHTTLVIDEAQRIDGIGLSLKILIDHVPGIQVIVTGSSALNLRNRTDEPLTGRNFSYTLLPPSFRELAAKDILTEQRALEERLVFGSYPGVLAESEDRARVLSSLASSYLYKDVLSLEGIAKPPVLDKLIRVLAFQVGQEVSFQELGGLVGIDRKTVEKYVDLLEKSFVLFDLSAYSGNLRNEIKKAHKIYFYDLGIRNAVIGNLLPLSARSEVEIGHLWENYLIAERLKGNVNLAIPVRSYFWRTHTQQEVDYIEEKNGTLLAWEMKWNPAKVKKTLPASFTNAYPNAQTGFVTPKNMCDFLLGY